MLLDFLLPAPCVVCGKLPKPICSECVPDIQVHHSTLFGVPLVFAGKLQGNLESLITSYKDSQIVSLEPVLVGILNQVASQIQSSFSFDALAIPPRNRRNFSRRGFHPIERLVSRSCLRGIPKVHARSIRTIADQRLLAAKERAGNIHRAFSLMPGKGNLLLVDDVLTTGATLSELKRAATAAGYRVSGICVIARR